MATNVYDAIIIGGGPAGMTALLYLGRGLVKTLLLEATGVGGQLLFTEKIENYIGFPGGIGAFDLIDKMQNHALEYGGTIETLEVGELKDLDKPVKTVVCKTGEVFQTKVIILASGARSRQLGVAGEEDFKARGVSYCGTCDGAFFRDKVIATIGGGDTCFDETVFLTRFAKKIYLIHRRKEFRAAAITVEKVKAMEKVEFVLDSVIEKINGDTTVRSVDVKNVLDGSTRNIPLDGVFVFVGLDPVNDYLLNSGVKLSAAGYVITDTAMRTNFPGVYAAGDLTEKAERQIATAVGDATVAACQAIKYLDSLR